MDIIKQNIQNRAEKLQGDALVGFFAKYLNEDITDEHRAWEDYIKIVVAKCTEVPSLINFLPE